MSHPPTIQHKSNSLVITISTVNPAEMHRALMMGINDAIRLYLMSSEKSVDIDGLLALTELQKSMIPGEAELEKSY